MTYNPNLYAPYTQPMTAPIATPTALPSWTYQQTQSGLPVNGLVSVTGIEGARAYQLPPNSKMPLFDQDADILYLKTTDSAGYPTIKAFRFEPMEQEEKTGYVTRDDFDALVARVDKLTAAEGASDGE